jgi:hypothetical protein
MPYHHFILFGGGSGNVYGVSNAATIEAAWDEIKKTDLMLAYAPVEGVGQQWPEYDSLNTMKNVGIKQHDGYWVITVPRSDEGQFGLLDAQSKNPDVQSEIETLGLQKYADEFVAEQARIDQDSAEFEREASDEQEAKARMNTQDMRRETGPRDESIKAQAVRLVDSLLESDVHQQPSTAAQRKLDKLLDDYAEWKNIYAPHHIAGSKERQAEQKEFERLIAQARAAVR